MAATRTPDQLVVDASVAVKWYLPDEPDTVPALALLRAFEAATVLLAALTQILYEIVESHFSQYGFTMLRPG